MLMSHSTLCLTETDLEPVKSTIEGLQLHSTSNCLKCVSLHKFDVEINEQESKTSETNESIYIVRHVDGKGVFYCYICNDNHWCYEQRNSSFKSELSPLCTCKISRLGNYQNLSYTQFSKDTLNGKLLFWTRNL